MCWENVIKMRKSPRVSLSWNSLDEMDKWKIKNANSTSVILLRLGGLQRERERVEPPEVSLKKVKIKFFYFSIFFIFSLKTEFYDER